jgi:hypothetical protein
VTTAASFEELKDQKIDLVDMAGCTKLSFEEKDALVEGILRLLVTDRLQRPFQQYVTALLF